jgi:hypothetical protein
MGRIFKNKFDTADILQKRAEAVRAIAESLAEDDQRKLLRAVAEDFEMRAQTVTYRARLKLQADFERACEKIAGQRKQASQRPLNNS